MGGKSGPGGRRGSAAGKSDDDSRGPMAPFGASKTSRSLVGTSLLTCACQSKVKLNDSAPAGRSSCSAAGGVASVASAASATSLSGVTSATSGAADDIPCAATKYMHGSAVILELCLKRGELGRERGAFKRCGASSAEKVGWVRPDFLSARHRKRLTQTKTATSRPTAMTRLTLAADSSWPFFSC